MEKALRANDIKFLQNKTDIISWRDKRRQRFNKEDFDRLLFLLMQEFQKACRQNMADLAVVNMGSEKIAPVERTCKELGIAYLDLSDCIALASKSEQLEFPINHHYNDVYHRIVGEYVSKYLRTKYNLSENIHYHYQYLGKFAAAGSQ